MILGYLGGPNGFTHALIGRRDENKQDRVEARM